MVTAVTEVARTSEILVKVLNIVTAAEHHFLDLGRNDLSDKRIRRAHVVAPSLRLLAAADQRPGKVAVRREGHDVAQVLFFELSFAAVIPKVTLDRVGDSAAINTEKIVLGV